MAVDDALLQQQYPDLWATYHLFPDAMDVLRRSDTMNPAELQAALRNTDSYKAMSDAQRHWFALSAINPGEAARRTADTMHQVQAWASRIGMPMDEASARNYANLVNSQGWTADAAYNVLVVGATKSIQAGHLAGIGELGASMADVRAIASSYAVPLTDAEAVTMGSGLLTKQQSKESITNQMTFRAMALYPTLKPQLESGMTVDDWAQPYKALAAQELEIGPKAMPLSDQKWRTMLQTSDPTSGQLRPMTLSEWQQKIRTDPGYGFDQTTNAKRTAAQYATTIAKEFGGIG